MKVCYFLILPIYLTSFFCYFIAITNFSQNLFTDSEKKYKQNWPNKMRKGSEPIAESVEHDDKCKQSNSSQKRVKTYLL